MVSKTRAVVIGGYFDHPLEGGEDGLSQTIYYNTGKKVLHFTHLLQMLAEITFACVGD
jgi:hypothetical protein